MNIELQEIFCCHDWAIEPIAGRQLYNALMAAIASQREGKDAEGMQKTAGFYLSKKKSFAGKLYVGDIHRIENRLYWRDEELADDDQIVNVVVIEGAVTRNGGACTYGSKEHRDQMVYANTIPQVVGHILLINTPGGMVSAMPDYTAAFDNCRANNKPTVALIDGICYSAGEWIACQCDHVIAMNPEDGFGCIGAMSCGELAPHGSINTVTQERTIILVGRGSPDKNREALEAAAGNDELMQAEADKNTERFHEVVRANRPMVTDDLLTGKTYPAREVMGRLVDEIGGMDRAIEVVFLLADGTMKPARDAEVIPSEPTDKQPGGDEQENAMHTLNGQQRAAVAANAGETLVIENGHVKRQDVGIFGEPVDTELATPQNNKEMTDEEKKAAEVAEQPAATQEQTPATEQPAEGAATEAPAVSEENAQEQAGAQAAAADNDMEGAPAEGAVPAGEAAGTEAPASQEAQETATSEIDFQKIQETLHTAEQKIAEKDQEIAKLKETLATLNGIAEERDQAIQERNDISASLEKAGLDYAEQGKGLTAAEAKIAEHVATIEKLNKQVKELQSEVKELSEKPAPMVDAGAGIPQDNGTGEAPKQKKRITRNMSYEEIRAAKEAERQAALAK